MADQDRVGARIAGVRKTRGWTGRELAGRAHVSYSLLSKVESGAAPASPALSGGVARALPVHVPRPTGQAADRVGVGAERGSAGDSPGALAADGVADGRRGLRQGTDADGAGPRRPWRGHGRDERA